MESIHGCANFLFPPGVESIARGFYTAHLSDVCLNSHARRPVPVTSISSPPISPYISSAVGFMLSRVPRSCQSTPMLLLHYPSYAMHCLRVAISIQSCEPKLCDSLHVHAVCRDGLSFPCTSENALYREGIR